MLELPVIVLLQQDCTDQPSNAVFVGKYANNVGAPFDFLVETLKGVRSGLRCVGASPGTSPILHGPFSTTTLDVTSGVRRGSWCLYDMRALGGRTCLYTQRAALRNHEPDLRDKAPRRRKKTIEDTYAHLHCYGQAAPFRGVARAYPQIARQNANRHSGI